MAAWRTRLAEWSGLSRWRTLGRALRLLMVLIAALAFLSAGALVLVDRQTRLWFEKDLAMRSELVVNGSRRALVSHWRRGDWTELRHLLLDITRDERIMAAAACTTEFRAVARTPDYPARFPCGDFADRLHPNRADPAEWSPWKGIVALPDGDVHLSALPVADANGTIGFVVLVHDMSWVKRRESTSRQFLLFTLGLLAACASVATLVAVRLSWKTWSNELRRLLQGGEERRPEFQPLMRDVRELAERLALEREIEGHSAAWTPQRLKQTLSRHLRGERVVVLANREPYIHERRPDGSVTVLHPASGLVTALEPVVRACSGTWVAHGSGSADRETSDLHGRVRVPPGEESYLVRRIWLSPEEERGYYYGFANEGLWPLSHMAHTRPEFRFNDWNHYQAVNEKFAEAACSEVDSEDPIILVQDYHFALVPKLIRERLPRATIIMFWHIPWPHSERFGICPWRHELLEGMVGSSIVGFQTQLHCNNFMDAVDRFMEARIDREQAGVVHHKRSALVRAYPISIEWPSRWLESVPSQAECRASVVSELGLPPNALVGVGVDRLDYTKGLEERLSAVGRLLERFPAFRGRFTFVQLAAPSRTLIERYRQLNESVERLARRINERFGTDRYQPIVLLRAHHEPQTVFRYYRAADVCYVSSLHDGMNLVAKEFVAARDDERGVLVLSQFTGAARELTEALMVNPYDLEEAASALATALGMSVQEQQARMRAMRSYLGEFNVYRWAGRILVDAARLRSRERLSGRLSEGLIGMGGAA